MLPEFVSFQKIARLSRECQITEKLDGTNGTIYISPELTVHAGSRNRWLTLNTDNFGFAAWVELHKDDLLKLGPGLHRGEWWGLGIQRGYGLFERRFSLFRAPKNMVEKPACVSFVPVLFEGLFDSHNIEMAMANLKLNGSSAAPGYTNPEGIVIFHKAAGVLFKKTFEGDEKGKEATNG